MRAVGEDVAALGVGLLIFVLSSAALFGHDWLGWSATAMVWLNPAQAIMPVAKGIDVGPFASIILTYLFSLVLLAVAIACMGLSVRRFAVGYTVIFLIGLLCFVAGYYGYVAATPEKFGKLGITWSLQLTGESGYIIALLVGLILGNFWPAFAGGIKEALRPELYIKIAIVIMGAALGVKSAETLGLARQVIVLGLCAVIGAYLIYWPVVYFVARRWFGFSREWAAPLASGISICGVSAAIATAAAIRARPVVAVMVSSLVVIFAVVELLALPFLAQHFIYQEPMVAGAWMGLVVKTDGAAIPAGTITDALIRAQAQNALGVSYAEGWISMAATTTKIFIDVFIGVWTFVLAVIWTTAIEPKPGVRVSVAEIWQRFPKFVLGYLLTFAVMLWLCLSDPKIIAAAKAATDEATVYRQLFFIFTFLTIGLSTNFRRLMAEGMGRLAAVYAVSLFGFIIWFGLLISWLFFAGVKPPLVHG